MVRPFLVAPPSEAPPRTTPPLRICHASTDSWRDWTASWP